MRISKSAMYAISALAAAGLLAACSGTGSQSSMTPTTQQNAAMGGGHSANPAHQQINNTLTAVVSHAQHADHHKSWVSPDAMGAPRLLFISDATYGDVYIFTMPHLALKGTITGFVEPQGMCSDASGNIWLANTEGNGSAGGTLVQMSRTGTVLKTIDDNGYYPVGCAVNKANGDLAVTNIISTSDNAGNVQVYANGSGTPTTYTAPNTFEYFFAGYDPSGNLLVDGEANISRTQTTLAELPAGSSSMKAITLSGSISFPGLVQWYNDGNYWAVGDQNANVVDWVTLSGSTASITGSTPIGVSGDMVQGTIAANGEKYLAGGTINLSSGSSVNRYPWPAGGTPTNSYQFAQSAYNEPIGAAVSTK
ncbi:MAG: hypothetical protein JOZ77_09105 [Candidatus Eremiobacteraeota bacterium]|nr:hypothetical protein [Candidatus Eremiobacteraeota bacterium]